MCGGVVWCGVELTRKRVVRGVTDGRAGVRQRAVASCVVFDMGCHHCSGPPQQVHSVFRRWQGRACRCVCCGRSSVAFTQCVCCQVFISPLEYDVRAMRYVLTPIAATLPSTGYSREYLNVRRASCVVWLPAVARHFCTLIFVVRNRLSLITRVRSCSSEQPVVKLLCLTRLLGYVSARAFPGFRVWNELNFLVPRRRFTRTSSPLHRMESTAWL
jgi:hypothetical protein